LLLYLVQRCVIWACRTRVGDVATRRIRDVTCYRWGVTPDREDSTPSDRVESSL